MTEPHRHQYPDIFQQLIDSAPLNGLGPGIGNKSALNQLQELTFDSFEQKISDRDMANCCISGLWLKHNFLDHSHTISQDIATPEGSYWHGIMHRREPDYSNAKYWFRRVGNHAIFRPLAEQILADETLAATASEFGLVDHGHFEPYAFVDACQQSATGKNEDSYFNLQKIAALEWLALFDFCYRAAIGNA